MKYVWKDKGEGEEKVEIFGNYQKLKTDKMITIGNSNSGKLGKYRIYKETRGNKKINENAEYRQ